jgi:hypothetical protein
MRARRKRAQIFSVWPHRQTLGTGCSNKSKLSASHNKMQAAALVMVEEMQFLPNQMATRSVQVRAKVESTFAAFLAEAAK